MSNLITLYHGTIHVFDSIDVTKGKPFKDFGVGFYVSQEQTHSSNLARRNATIELERLNVVGKTGEVHPYLYSYKFDLADLERLNVKEFKAADEEWVQFVTYNRSHKFQKHSYDIVIGPTANDDTMPTVNLYLRGALGPVNNNATVKRFLELIEPLKLPKQSCFSTQKSVELLKFVERSKLA